MTNFINLYTFLGWIASTYFFSIMFHISMGNPTTLSNIVNITISIKGNSKDFHLSVDKCIWLEQNGIPRGELESIKFQNLSQCVEIHEYENCEGDFVIARGRGPTNKQLYRWTLNGTRKWIDAGAKAITPCRDKCLNIETPEKDELVQISLFSKIGFNGTRANLTIKGCEDVPKKLQHKIKSVRIENSSFCIELHELIDCSGDSIEIPKLTPWQLTRDLGKWNFSQKAVSASYCGYSCPNFPKDAPKITNQDVLIITGVLIAIIVVFLIVLSIIKLRYLREIIMRLNRLCYDPMESAMELGPVYTFPKNPTTNCDADSDATIYSNRNQDRHGQRLTNMENLATSFPRVREIIPKTSVSIYSGRDKELKILSSFLKDISTPNRLLLIYGASGVGKTELCKQFEKHNCNRRHIRFLWLSGESIEHFLDSISIMTSSWKNFPKKADPFDYFRNFALVILKEFDQLLLFIDNMDNDKQVIRIIKKTLLEIENIWMIVISKHNLSMGTTIKLDILPKYDAKKMLQMSMNNLSNNYAEELANLVNCFPIALKMTAAYITHQKDCNVSSYINEYNAKKAEISLEGLDECHISITTMLDLTISKIWDDNIWGIIRILAHLQPNRVDLKFLQRICELQSIINFEEALDTLHKYSLVVVYKDGINEIVTIDRLTQTYIIEIIEDYEEYSKSLFDCVLLTSKGLFGKERSFEKSQLRSVSRLTYRKFRITNYFYETLLFLLENNRVNCAKQYVKAICTKIEFSSDAVKSNIILEKVFLWGIFNDDYDNVTNEIVENCNNYDSNSLLDHLEINSLKAGINKSQLYFIKGNKIIFKLKTALVKKLCIKGEIKETFTLLEELGSEFKPDDEQKMVYFETVKFIVNVLGETNHWEEIETLFKLVAKLDDTAANEILKRLEKQANGLKTKGYLQLSQGMYKQLYLIFKQLGNQIMTTECYNKLIRLELQMTNLNEISRQGIEEKFGDADYENLSLRTLEGILRSYEKILSQDHLLTCKVQFSIAKLIFARDKDKCVKLCGNIIASEICEQYEYEMAFVLLCEVKEIEDNCSEQRTMLRNFLGQKILKLGESHICTLEIKRLLFNVNDRLS